MGVLVKPKGSAVVKEAEPEPEVIYHHLQSWIDFLQGKGRN
jgi:hypothetical protein